MKKTWRQWWRWVAKPWLRFQWRARVMSRLPRPWPWTELDALRATNVALGRQIASCNLVIGVANKTIAEFQERLYRYGDASALDQRDPRYHKVAPKVIVLTRAEAQSGLDRVRWAEGLIRQLPPEHEGRNSWLLSYGGRVPGGVGALAATRP